MRTLNRVFLVGALGKDPEIKSTGGGTLVANFSVATSESYKDKSGDWQTKTEWHNLVAYARTAEIIRDYLKKGATVHIEGKLQTRNWEDKDSGKKTYRTEIIVDSLIMLGGKRDDDSGSRDRSTRSGESSNSKVFDRDDGTNSDDDIPF